MNATNLRVLRVLVVDDEPEIRYLLSDILEGAGHQVRSAPDGASAARLLAEDPAPFDPAFLDFHMPEGNGLSVMDRLREIQSDLRVVLVTGQTGPLPAVPSGSAEDGSFAILTKPFSLELLEDLLEKVQRGEKL